MTVRNKILLVGVALMLVTATAFAQSSTFGGLRRNVTHQVIVNSNVRDADVFVNGDLQRVRTPAAFNLAPGRYEIRVEARGYLSWTLMVVVDSDTTLYAELRRPHATIRLELPSEYINWQVRRPHDLITYYVDGEIRRGPEVQVAPGWHEIAIVSGGLRFAGDVYLESGSVYSLDLMLRLAMLPTVEFVWR